MYRFILIYLYDNEVFLHSFIGLFHFCPTLGTGTRTFEIAFTTVFDRDLRLKDTLLPKHPTKGNAIAPVY